MKNTTLLVLVGSLFVSTLSLADDVTISSLDPREAKAAGYRIVKGSPYYTHILIHADFSDRTQTYILAGTACPLDSECQSTAVYLVESSYLPGNYRTATEASWVGTSNRGIFGMVVDYELQKCAKTPAGFTDYNSCVFMLDIPKFEYGRDGLIVLE